MALLFGTRMLRDRQFFDLKTNLAEIALEAGFAGGGPEGDPSAGGESAIDGLQSLASIDPGVSLLEQ